MAHDDEIPGWWREYGRVYDIQEPRDQSQKASMAGPPIDDLRHRTIVELRVVYADVRGESREKRKFSEFALFGLFGAGILVATLLGIAIGVFMTTHDSTLLSTVLQFLRDCLAHL